MYNKSPILGISNHTAESIETWIAKWLADELGIQVDLINTRKSFVKYGIDSLTLLMLTDDLGLWLQRRLPPTLAWEHNSIEAIAQYLTQKSDFSVAGTWSSLVKIQPGGSKPPFFGVHAVADNVIPYYNLARYWDREQPVYGLQPQGLDGKQVPHNRFEDMATNYIREIRTIQPQGPYFLGGYSMGGAVALEMAQQLHAQGQKVAMLALFDAHGPEWIKRLPFHARFSRHLDNLLRLEPKEKLTYVKKKLSQRFYSQPQEHHQAHVQEQSPLLEAHVQATRDYVYQVYSGRAILFRALEQPEDEFRVIDPQLGWGSLIAGGLEIQEVTGDHFTMFSEPYVRVLAEKLKACLDQAQANLDANYP
jgi:aspartate racemase